MLNYNACLTVTNGLPWEEQTHRKPVVCQAKIFLSVCTAENLDVCGKSKT